MTFQEAFNSGCRFKLPANYGEYGSWPDGWWFIKNDNDSVIILARGTNSITLKNLFNERLSHIYFNSSNWYLHPDDVFQSRLEDVLK